MEHKAHEELRTKPLSRVAAYGFATFFGAGRCPVAPGTAGSLAAVFLFVLAKPLLLASPVLFGLVIAGTTLLGTVAAGCVARTEGKEDPSKVVVDEVAGQWLTFFLLPFVSWKVLVLGFLLFRAFDIWKPFPAAQAERVPGGTGIMLDDLVAGLYANLLLQAICRFPWSAPWLG